MPSLRRRLILWLILGAAAMGGLALIDTRAEAVRIAQGVSDRVLAGSAMAIAERITVSDDGGVDVMVPFSALEMLSSTAQDLVFYRVDGPQGFITGYADLPVAADSGDELSYADITYGPGDLRAATLRRQLSFEGGTLDYVVTVAESTLAREALGRTILLRSALRLGLLIAAVAVIAWVLVSVALRPLERLGAGISRRGVTDLRPIDTPVPREVAPLVAAINLFMTRLDGAIVAMGRFTANANHQIRTPLTTARTHLALAGRSVAERPASLAKADSALVRAERVLEQLLLLARLDAEGAVPQLVTVDLAGLARGIATENIPRAAARGQDLGYDGPDQLLVRAEPVLLAEALRNLVDNALIHNRSGVVVTLRVSAEPDGAAVSVSDDGGGIPASAAAVLTGSGRTSRASAGAEHGLGLSIVHEVARLCRARLGVESGAGGTRVTLTFPYEATGAGV